MTAEPVDAAAGLPPELRERHGVPTPQQAERHARAVELVRAACRELPGGAQVRVSPLGPQWGRDIDVHVTALPDPTALARLGWLRLDPLLERLGKGPGCRWAVVEHGAVLAMADFHMAVAPTPVAAVRQRCRDRGEVRLREAWELRALTTDDLAAAADPVLRAAATLQEPRGFPVAPVPLPVPLWRRVARRRPRRHRRFVVAVSGVDGAGKSTLTAGLRDQLAAAQVPAEVVWARPGMSAGPRLAALAVRAKRLLRQDPAPGVRAVAAGDAPALRSRTGLVGWLWVMVVTCDYLAQVRGAHRRARGVVLYDRHLHDALTTLDFAYSGVRLGAARALVRLLLPRADLSLFLDVPADLALARKPDDPFGSHAVRTQLTGYDRVRAEARDLVVLDATLPREQVRLLALQALLGAAA